MADDDAGPEPQESAEPVEPQERVEPLEPRQSFVRRHWGKLLIATVILSFVIVAQLKHLKARIRVPA